MLCKQVQLTGDSHHFAIVHWAGQKSPVIVIATRDITETSKSTSEVYISPDYGKSFVKKSHLLKLASGKNAVIYFYYPSNGDKGSDEKVP